MIWKGASGTAAEIQFSLSAGGVMNTSKTWTSGDLKIGLPGTTAIVNATVGNIVNRGGGIYGLQLTAGESASVGKVFVMTNVAGADGNNQAYTDEILDPQTIATSVATQVTTDHGAGSYVETAAPTAAAVAAAVWGYAIEGTYTATHYLRLIASSTVWKLSGLFTNAPKFRDAADTKDRITGTTTSDGRTAVSVDPT